MAGFSSFGPVQSKFMIQTLGIEYVARLGGTGVAHQHQPISKSESLKAVVRFGVYPPCNLDLLHHKRPQSPPRADTSDTAGAMHCGQTHRDFPDVVRRSSIDHQVHRRRSAPPAKDPPRYQNLMVMTASVNKDADAINRAKRSRSPSPYVQGSKESIDISVERKQHGPRNGVVHQKSGAMRSGVVRQGSKESIDTSLERKQYGPRTVVRQMSSVIRQKSAQRVGSDGRCPSNRLLAMPKVGHSPSPASRMHSSGLLDMPFGFKPLGRETRPHWTPESTATPRSRSTTASTAQSMYSQKLTDPSTLSFSSDDTTEALIMICNEVSAEMISSSFLSMVKRQLSKESSLASEVSTTGLTGCGDSNYESGESTLSSIETPTANTPSVPGAASLSTSLGKRMAELYESRVHEMVKIEQRRAWNLMR